MTATHTQKSIRINAFFLAIGFLFISVLGNAQTNTVPDTTQYLTLDQCIAFALQNQPTMKQSSININIAKTTNAINEAGLLPQVNLAIDAQHYLQQPTTFISDSANPGGPPIAEKTGVVNTIIPQLSLSQNIYNPELSYAVKTASLYVKQAELNADSTKINVITTVSQAFYSLLLTLQQIGVLQEDTARLTKNYNDSYHQYVGGIVDQTDYKEAAISLNNSIAQLKQAVNNVSPQYATLKQLMGFPQTKQFNVSFDTAQMVKDIAFDTTQQLKYEQRIEFQQVLNSKKLQQALTNYYRHAFLPTISAYADYYPEFESNKLSNVFTNVYPYSTIGISLTMPIFTGFSRLNNVKKSQYQEQLISLDQDNLESTIFTEYATALANYKSNLTNFYFLRENVSMAKDVYKVVSLQYLQGTVAYLNVITAESNLITAEIGYQNAISQVLSSKIDLEKAMGIIR
jgi:outer membrane protein TolC